MEFGRVTRMFSKFMQDSIVLYDSKTRTDAVYKFRHNGKNEYRCCRCEELGKT